MDKEREIGYNETMYIKSVSLKNFRNYESAAVEFRSGLNVIVGENASGKTNLIESVYCCGIGKSPRVNRYKDLILWEKDFAYIKVELVKKFRTHQIEFYIDRQDKKRIMVDGIPLNKIGELIGLLNIVYFSPDEMKLIKESPQERRRFMDISLVQQSKPYYYALGNYNNILAQRNKLLKSGYRKDTLQQTLYAWDGQLADYGAYLVRKRYEFVRKLNDYAKEVHSFLTDGKEQLTLQYESDLQVASTEEIKRIFLEKLKESLEKDMNLYYTSCGPHRDDVCIRVNDVDVRKFGSQGQQRTGALSLKLAEIALFREELGEAPILLLDDVLSELDEKRRLRLIEFSAQLQTMLTCTDFHSDGDYNQIKIVNGTIEKGNQ